ncbi:hypothetical protein [Paenibacillus lautus]|uniref:hypothetical protein n=1 Tax=Paenibacillus lautus TaxID=1401 RepID=UPI003D2E76EA
MNKEYIIQEKLDKLLESFSTLNDKVNLALSHNEERLNAIERLMWKIEKKLIDQNKALSLLSKNELIDRLVTMKYYNERIKPMHLQSEEYQRSSIEAMYDDDEHD